jgi:cell division protein FtsQ
VHFGDGKFLERYREYEQHLAEWRAQYPKLASVDLRYQQQVVLEMQPGTSATSDAPPSDAPPASGESASADNAKPLAHTAAMAHAAPAKSKLPLVAKPATSKPSSTASTSRGDAR